MNPYAKYRKLVLCVLLSFCLLFSLTACGKNTSGGSDRDEDSQEEEDISSDAEDEAEEDGDEDVPDGQSDENGEPDGNDTAGEDGQTGFVTTPKLEDAQALFLAAEEDYCAVVVFNCPQRTTDVQVVGAMTTDGSRPAYFDSVYLEETRSSGVWFLIHTFSKPVDVAEFDTYSVDVTAVVGNGEETRSITGLKMAAPEEWEALGLSSVAGHPFIAPPCGVYLDNDYFGFRAHFYIFGKNGIDEQDFTADHFRFFAGDGTPLEERFPGNAFTIRVAPPDEYVQDYEVKAFFELSSSDEAESLAGQLEACEPYMVYTGPGGDTWSAPMIPAE